MIKDETKKLIDKAIEIELQNALEQKEFADAHHAYAILKEELEEAEFYFRVCCFQLEEEVWRNIKDDEMQEAKSAFNVILQRSKRAMAELARVAAVCEKVQRQRLQREPKMDRQEE